jgi:glycosyltransferase involved in cell wall biosynthesis
MRIAYICADPGVPVFGCKGASIHVQEVIRALRRRGAQVTLLAVRWGGTVPAGLEGLAQVPLPAIVGGELAAREQAALAANAALEHALSAAGPFDLVYERYALWSHAGMSWARVTGIPALLEVNAPLIEEQARHRRLTNRVAAEQVTQVVFAAATTLLAVSQEVARYLERQPVARGRVHVVPNGVDPQRFRPGRAPARAREDGTFVLGFAGSFKSWHGLDTLFKAFMHLYHARPTARLLVVGDGPERARLVGQVIAGQLEDAVILPGAVAPEKMPSWLAAMDIAVAPYPDLEDFYFSPLKVFEYMAAGLPVVASRIGQLAKLIVDGETGLLCPPGDATALASALGRLAVDHPLRGRLARGGRQAVLRSHTWDHVAARILGLAGLDRPLISVQPANPGSQASHHVSPQVT